ncbi:alanine dehydrogenase [Solemya velum gill symbiont]|uniref:alanine dehydrogenase n=1 Tax=Solemya velum gill symbiont TaxID=2340 RepID=UPI000997B938|nr:alanine dehydrogenase [Solemya velum gill symbiont]OOY52693.1 alanine dehydrogenase [Solemya velum gill symbiont]OOY65786.1 alanine dehydrogenase [Solemya velum gill symbiont]OOY67818.1 alanine dehydrogenase [Solemya velum gill symbiont]OOY70279.1 alanine dehydrogenase [Solemya velum gill symbiont]OOY80016.1 alanine dehydrogenase [Solemya velum gill symbiont]
MLIGVPTEIKNNEYRVGLIPASVRELVSHGHQVLVQKDAGSSIDFSNREYLDAGAELAGTPDEVFLRAGMIVKVKEPQPDECAMLRNGQLLFTYLHLAPDPRQTELLIKSGATCVAYETVTDEHGGLPLLAPMSEVAGRMSAQEGAYHLEMAQGGRGVLLGGVPGVAPAKVLIIGGGVVGENATAMAVGMGAEVTIIDRSIARLRELDNDYKGRVRCIYSTTTILEKYALDADLVIGAVLVPGAAAPKLLTRDMIRRMKRGAVIIDVAIDQGGCFETSHPTTHEKPTFVVDDVVHYCVANMPGGVARTASMALNNATLPFTLALADDPIRAMMRDHNLLNGLNVHAGQVTYKAVAEALGYDYVPATEALKQAT